MLGSYCSPSTVRHVGVGRKIQRFIIYEQVPTISDSYETSQPLVLSELRFNIHVGAIEVLADIICLDAPFPANTKGRELQDSAALRGRDPMKFKSKADH